MASFIVFPYSMLPSWVQRHAAYSYNPRPVELTRCVDTNPSKLCHIDHCMYMLCAKYLHYSPVGCCCPLQELDRQSAVNACL